MTTELPKLRRSAKSEPLIPKDESSKGLFKKAQSYHGTTTPLTKNQQRVGELFLGLGNDSFSPIRRSISPDLELESEQPKLSLQERSVSNSRFYMTDDNMAKNKKNMLFVINLIFYLMVIGLFNNFVNKNCVNNNLKNLVYLCLSLPLVLSSYMILCNKYGEYSPVVMLVSLVLFWGINRNYDLSDEYLSLANNLYVLMIVGASILALLQKYFLV